MKKPGIVWGLILTGLAIVAVTITMQSQKQSGDSFSNPSFLKESELPPRSAIQLSQLAFESHLNNPDADRNEIKALYALMQDESNDLSSTLSSKRPTYLMNKEGIDICPCPSSRGGNCPCPPDTTSFVSQTKAIVAIDSHDIKPKMIRGSRNTKWQYFPLPLDLKEGTHVLTITGDFTKVGPKTYTVPFDLKSGKLYTRWK